MQVCVTNTGVLDVDENFSTRGFWDRDVLVLEFAAVASEYNSLLGLWDAHCCDEDWFFLLMEETFTSVRLGRMMLRTCSVNWKMC